MNKLTALRKELGFKTIKAFADFVHIPYTTVHKWEKRGNLPDAVNIGKICQYFPKINPKYFAGDNEAMFDYTFVHQASPEGLKGEIRVFGRVAAGAPIATWGDGDYTMVITGHPRVDKISGKVQGFVVDGDSFDREYSRGDLVYATYIDYPSQMPKDGDWVITFFDTEPETVKVTVKEFQWLDLDKKMFLLKPRSKDERFKDTMHKFKGVRTMLKVQYGLKFASN